jgi:transcriptional regulator with XRE-family HTH domain
LAGGVPERGSLKIGRRRLAAELRRLRDHSGLTGDEVAAQLGWSGSKISRIELNRSEIKASDLIRLLDLYGVGGEQRAELLTVAQGRRVRGWWEAYSDAVQPGYASYIELESEAQEARCWSSQLVHGLLQTEDYSRAVMQSHEGWMELTSPGLIRKLIEVRMVRQHLVTEKQSLGLHVVIDESVLLRQLGTPQIMREQLERLVTLSRLPNVTMQVLPLAGEHPVGTGSFVLLVFPPVLDADSDEDAVYIEQLTRNELYADDEAEVHHYRSAFEQLAQKALSPAASRELASRVASEVWS